MFTSVQTIIYVVFVAFILSFNVNASVHRLEITVPDNEPVIEERFSVDSSGTNGSVLSREVINHVRHKHEQTIGNVHIVTNIDIANLITILNTSAPISVHSIHAPSSAAMTSTAESKCKAYTVSPKSPHKY